MGARVGGWVQQTEGGRGPEGDEDDEGVDQGPL